MTVLSTTAERRSLACFKFSIGQLLEDYLFIERSLITRTQSEGRLHHFWGTRGDRQNFDLRGDRTNSYGDEGRSPELQFKGRSLF